MIDIDYSQYMTFEEAASSLGLAVSSVRSMVSNGVLEGRKHPFGGTMIVRESVTAYSSTSKKTGRPRKASQSVSKKSL